MPITMGRQFLSMNSSATYNMSPVVVTGQTTTLGAAITTTGGLSLTTSANFSFMPSTPFYIMIDSEQMSVTAVSSNTWTITRGDGGTTAATHLINATITQMQMRWKNFTGAATFSNIGGTVIIDTITTNAAVTADYGIGLFAPLPATSGYTITACLAVYMPFQIPNVSCGMCVVDSTNNKYVTAPLTFAYNGSWLGPGALNNGMSQWAGSSYMTALTGQSASYPIGFYYGMGCAPTPSNPIWLRMVDDTTNLNLYISYDGVNFVKVSSAARLSYLTVPSDYGFYISPRGGRIGIQCMALSVTTP